MNLGAHTRIHSIYGSRARLVGIKCYFCRGKIQIKTGETLFSHSCNGHMYCSSCFLQALNNTIGQDEVSKVNRWYKKKCKTCGKSIGRIHEYCYDCSPYVNHYEPKKRKPKQFVFHKPKRDTAFSTKNTLRMDLAFCQNADCPCRKPMSKIKMYKVKSEDRNSRLIMYFCSRSCAEVFLGNNDYLKYTMYV